MNTAIPSSLEKAADPTYDAASGQKPPRWWDLPRLFQSVKESKDMPTSDKTKLVVGVDWLVRLVVLICPILWLMFNQAQDAKFASFQKSLDGAVARIEAQQAILTSMTKYMAQGQPLTLKDGDNLKLWVENYVKDEVPPPEVTTRLDKGEAEDREIRKDVAALERDVAEAVHKVELMRETVNLLRTQSGGKQ